MLEKFGEERIKCNLVISESNTEFSIEKMDHFKRNLMTIYEQVVIQKDLSKIETTGIYIQTHFYWEILK